MTEYLPTIIAIMICVVASVTDIRSLRIYNWLTIPALAAGILWQVSAHGAAGLQDGLLGMAIAFAVLFIPFLIGAMGAGDVKLMTALGAWVGFQGAALVVLVACLLAGLNSLAILIRRGGLAEAWINLQVSWLRVMTLRHHLVLDEPAEFRDENNSSSRFDLLPFSVMILVAILVLLAVQVGGVYSAQTPQLLILFGMMS